MFVILSESIHEDFDHALLLIISYFSSFFAKNREIPTIINQYTMNITHINIFFTNTIPIIPARYTTTFNNLSKNIKKKVSYAAGNLLSFDNNDQFVSSKKNL